MVNLSGTLLEQLQGIIDDEMFLQVTSLYASFDYARFSSRGTSSIKCILVVFVEFEATMLWEVLSSTYEIQSFLGIC